MRKAFSVVMRRNLVLRHADRIGQNIGRVRHIGRLVALAAERLGRKIRCVGLDDHAIMRNRLGDLAQFFRFREGQDAGEGDVAAELDADARQIRTRRKAMQKEREGALPCLLGQDRRHVVVGRTAVNDERQTGFARRRDMPAQTLDLRFARRVVVEVIETRLADRHHLRVRREPDEIVNGDIELFIRIVRMRADGTEDVRIGFGDRKDRVEPLHAGRDRDHLADARCARALDDSVALSLEVGKIQMAMRIDKHADRALLRFRCDIAREDRLRRFKRRSGDETARLAECRKVALVGWRRHQVEQFS